MNCPAPGGRVGREFMLADVNWNTQKQKTHVIMTQQTDVEFSDLASVNNVIPSLLI